MVVLFLETTSLSLFPSELPQELRQKDKGI